MPVTGTEPPTMTQARAPDPMAMRETRWDARVVVTEQDCRASGPGVKSTSMAREWTTLRELLLPAASMTTRGRHGRGVESALREAIRDGQLAAGTRLPSSRDLASQLGISRGTVTAAYGQLVAEGYLTSRRGSGTTVAEDLGCGLPDRTPPGSERRWRYD